MPSEENINFSLVDTIFSSSTNSMSDRGAGDAGGNQWSAWLQKANNAANIISAGKQKYDEMKQQEMEKAKQQRLSERDMIEEDIDMDDTFERETEMAKAISIAENMDGMQSTSAAVRPTMTRSTSGGAQLCTPTKSISSLNESMSPTDEQFTNPMVVPAGRVARKLSASVIYTSTEETVEVDDATFETAVAQASKTTVIGSFSSAIGGMITSAREKWQGIDYWIPSDPFEPAVFPTHILAQHKRILPETVPDRSTRRVPMFMLVEGNYDKPSKPSIQSESVYHVTFLFNRDVDDTAKTYSLHRSTDYHDAVRVYHSCLMCRDLFSLFESGAKLKSSMSALMKNFDKHPLWDAVHIAALMGIKAYFEAKHARRVGILRKLLAVESQPQGHCPLHIACEANNIELVKYLLSTGEAQLCQVDINGNNALHYAARASSAMLDVIFANDADEANKLLNSANNEGSTPLMITIKNGNAICLYTLMRNGAELRSKGRSALHEAMQATSNTSACTQYVSLSSLTLIPRVIRTLITASPGIVGETDAQTGNTALHVASNKHPLGALLALNHDIASGRPIDPVGSPARKANAKAASSKKLKTATSPDEAVDKRVAAFVSAAVNDANEESMETDESKSKSPPPEKFMSISVDARNQSGQTPLHVHTHRGDVGSVVTMIAYGADVNAKDAHGNTPLHIAVGIGQLQLTRALLVLGAYINVTNARNDTPRHLASKLNDIKTRVDIVRSLAICGALRCPTNKKGCAFGCVFQDKSGVEKSTVDLTITPSSTSNALMKAAIAEIDRGTVPTVGAKAKMGRQDTVQKLTAERRQMSVATKEESTGEVWEVYKPPRVDLNAFRQHQCVMATFEKLEKTSLASSSTPMSARPEHWSALLSLDGGGIRGLITIQLLIALEDALGDRAFDYFDWVAGTSTGSFIAAALTKGFTLRECQGLYLRLKDQLFEGWVRPYNTEQLETFIKTELGDETTMGDFKEPKVVVTTVNAEHVPTELHLFRSYQLPCDDETNAELGYNTELWRALRCSSAAPSYFQSIDGYVDGGLMANNPAAVLMTAVSDYNTAVEAIETVPRTESTHRVGVVLSLGCGRIPDVPIADIDIGSGIIGSAMAVKNLGFMLVEQATACDGLPVTQARSWCHAMGTPYYRLSTHMTRMVELDTKDDLQLVQMMWDTQVTVSNLMLTFQEYIYTQRADIAELAQMLAAAGKRNSPQRERQRDTKFY